MTPLIENREAHFFAVVECNALTQQYLCRRFLYGPSLLKLCSPWVPFFELIIGLLYMRVMH